MKRQYITYGLIVLIGIIGLVTLGAPPVEQEIRQGVYTVIRSEANEDASTLAGCFDLTTKGDFDQIDSAAVCFIPPPSTNVTGRQRMTFIFCGGDTEDETFSWTILAWSNLGGPAERVAYGTGILGTQAVVKYPHNGATATSKFWADTLVVTANYWPTSVGTIDAGSNSIAKLSLLTRGYKYWRIYIYDASNATTEAGNITVYFRWWSE